MMELVEPVLLTSCLKETEPAQPAVGNEIWYSLVRGTAEVTTDESTPRGSTAQEKVDAGLPTRMYAPPFMSECYIHESSYIYIYKAEFNSVELICTYW